jgi:hypothetical protein
MSREMTPPLTFKRRVMESPENMPQWATFGAIVAYIVKDWLSSQKNNIKEIKEDLKLLRAALRSNTIELTKVTVSLDHFKEDIDKIPKLEKDVNAAHKKLRGTSNDL